MALQLQARVLKDKRTKNLIRRLKAGDIALISHQDLDITAARALVERRVAAVINTEPSISGRYPNRGPAVLLESSIPLLDCLEDDAFNRISDGSIIEIFHELIRTRSNHCFHCSLMTPERMEMQMEAARANLHAELDLFARNTLQHLEQEEWLLYDPLETPKLRTNFADRHTLIVVRGEGYKQDLSMLSSYLHDVRPVLVGVDGGADALLEARLKPDVIIGDMDSISDDALRCGAEIVVHGYLQGDKRGVPGIERIADLGLKAEILHSAGTSEDVAMLLADALGARIIVAVGTHFSLEEFLDKGRKGMASTFLTRLRIGSKLVDAKGIARLYTGQHIRMRDYLLIMLAAITPILAIFVVTREGRAILQFLEVWLRFRLR